MRAPVLLNFGALSNFSKGSTCFSCLFGNQSLGLVNLLKVLRRELDCKLEQPTSNVQVFIRYFCLFGRFFKCSVIFVSFCVIDIFINWYDDLIIFVKFLHCLRIFVCDNSVFSLSELNFFPHWCPYYGFKQGRVGY